MKSSSRRLSKTPESLENTDFLLPFFDRFYGTIKVSNTKCEYHGAAEPPVRCMQIIGRCSLGDVIRFDKVSKNTEEKEERKDNTKKKPKSSLATVGIIVGIIAGICGILGTSVVGIYNHFFTEDWQERAEQYNNKELDLYNLGRYEESIECMIRL